MGEILGSLGSGSCRCHWGHGSFDQGMSTTLRITLFGPPENEMKIIWQALLLKGGAPNLLKYNCNWPGQISLFCSLRQVDLVIGTPPQRASVILDTGSGALLACFAALCCGFGNVIKSLCWSQKLLETVQSTFPRLRFVHTPVRTANTASSSAVPCSALRGSFVRVLVLGVLSSILPRWSSYGSSVKAWVVADQTTLGM